MQPHRWITLERTSTLQRRCNVASFPWSIFPTQDDGHSSIRRDVMGRLQHRSCDKSCALSTCCWGSWDLKHRKTLTPMMSWIVNTEVDSSFQDVSKDCLYVLLIRLFQYKIRPVSFTRIVTDHYRYFHLYVRGTNPSYPTIEHEELVKI